MLTAPRAPPLAPMPCFWAALPSPRRAERALDMCSGCGIISLLWHDAGHRGPCTALELDPDASALCVSGRWRRMASTTLPLCRGDLRMFCAAGPEQGKYDFAACNPPYFTAGPQSPDPVRAAARHTVTCTTEGCGPVRPPRAAADGGRFCAVPTSRPTGGSAVCPAHRPAGT